MLHFVPSAPPRPLPKRNDSLVPVKPKAQTHSPTPNNEKEKDAVLFAGVEDDLRDARRVHTHGQEEDLRYALNKMINRVSELTALLKDAHRQHADLSTTLNLAHSNLQLLMSNNEMLEEALARAPGSEGASSVGWRRWSAKEGERREERPKSLDYAESTDKTSNNAGASTNSGTASPTSPASAQDSRFFRFRFSSGNVNGKGSVSTTPTRSQSPVPAAQSPPSHLTSNSLPSLVPPPPGVKEREKELEERLDRERAEREKAYAAKAALEAELESLSQALFEEANKMVATERIRRAETEEELREARLEKEALRSALRLVEGENGRLRGEEGGAEKGEGKIKEEKRERSASEVGVKSPVLPSQDELEEDTATSPPERTTPPPPAVASPPPSTASHDPQEPLASPELLMYEPSPWADAR